MVHTSCHDWLGAAAYRIGPGLLPPRAASLPAAALVQRRAARLAHTSVLGRPLHGATLLACGPCVAACHSWHSSAGCPAPAQHTFRIYPDWNLTRTNPLFIPLSTLWASTLLAFVRRLDRRAWVFLLLFTAHTAIALSSSHHEAL